MKKTITILTLLSCIACQPQIDKTKTVLQGKVATEEITRIKLSYVDSKGYVDTILSVTDKKFSITMPVDFPTNVSLSVDSKRLSFWTEPGIVNISLPQELENYSMEESEIDLLAKTFHKTIAEENRQIEALPLQTTDPEERKVMIEQYEKIQKSISQKSLAFITQHPSSYFSAHLLFRTQSTLSPEETQKYLNMLVGEVTEKSPYIRRIKQDIAGELQGQPGKKAPILSGTDINGEHFDMQNLIGKQYIIVDFWASWCKPCRAMNPHLKELYKKYQKEGITVICISDNDSNEDAWRKAVADDQLEEFVHLLRGWEGMRSFFDLSNDKSSLYGIHSLPTKFLIDKEGIIIGRYGGGGEPHEAMDTKLKELFGY